jgi:hypothetical protein
VFVKILRCERSIVVVVALVLAGCGGGYTPDEGVVVEGKILQGGQPLEVPNREVGLGSVEVQLIPTGALAGQVGVETALAEADGSFRVQGAGRGIKPGKYKVVVYQHDQGMNSDKLQGAFSDQNSPIEVDIAEDNVGDAQDLGVIELNDHKK